MIKDVFDQLDPLLKAAITGLTHDFGAEHEEKQSAPPRIVWVPTDDTFGAAQQSNRAADQSSALNPRHLFRVGAGVRIRFWGAPEYQNAWALVVTFVQQLYKVPVYGSVAFRLVRGGWDPGNGGLARLGRSYHLWAEFGVPLTEAAPTVATMTDVPQTNKVNFPSPPPAGHVETV